MKFAVISTEFPVVHQFQCPVDSRFDYAVDENGDLRYYPDPPTDTEQFTDNFPVGWSCFSPITFPHDKPGSDIHRPCFRTAFITLNKGWRMVFTHTMILNSSGGTRSTADHFLIYPCEAKTFDQFLTEPFEDSIRPWHPCTQKVEESNSDCAWVFGDWAEDSRNISDIRVRWILSCIVNVFIQDTTLPASILMLLNDIYTWIVAEQPSLQSFTQHRYRCWVLLKLMQGSDEQVQARMDEVMLFLEKALHEAPTVS